MRAKSLLRLLSAVTLFTFAASAADTFYLGAWKIVSASVAPWADPAARKPDPTEMKGLVGKTVTFTAAAVQGPREVACKSPRYTIREDPANMLFEGAFDEMHTKDKSVDPQKVAMSLGFRGAKWKTLETGCEIEISYHFLDPMTAAFGLNDYVYTLKKQ
jgi:hypothetical protein